MATITLTNADNERLLEAHPGDENLLLLAETATTGYRWHVGQAEGGIGLQSDGYQTPEQTEGKGIQFGRGGIRRYRFRVVAPGTFRLALKNWREWEGEGSVLERFAVTVRAF